MEYKKKAHSVYLMTYHLVFVTKYRARLGCRLRSHLQSLRDTERSSDLIRRAHV